MARPPGRPADDAVFPPEIMRRFATDPAPRMRVLALRDPELPTEPVEHLARDEEARVRREAAAHSNLPVPAPRLLLGDTDEVMEALIAVADL
ncbi:MULTISPECIES: hypothetical protein [unclassified Streptomyces]|uniref:hypothetical protein n=1 Tax=unclassified Streptomyces TaxID=2593676 RepID=UPI0004BD007D|nr:MULTISPECIES: hypothetical protein [unclassified Streptomyces]